MGEHHDAMAAEAVEFCRSLIRIDSTNTGDPATTGDGESRCAEYIQSLLAETGLECQWVEKVPGRGNIVVRMKGRDPDAAALLVHGHTDVVPADVIDWTVDPFSGEVKDGFIWGRGAVDMKDMVAMTVAAVRQLRRENFVPRRDIVFAFVADEEIAGEFGAGFLVDEHPDLFHGVTEAIGEIGGFSLQLNEDLRIYLLGVAEKGVAWATLTARGTTGHGSIVPNEANAVARLSAALAHISSYEWPVVRSASITALAEQLGEVLGRPLDLDRLDEELGSLGSLAAMLRPGLRSSTVPTQFHAGYQTNVVPGTATATVDCRIAPGTDDEFKEQFMELLGPGIEVSWSEGRSLEAPANGPLLDAMKAAITAVDPAGRGLPFVISGATDAKAFSRLGINCYGFSPLRLPADFDFAGMFHGIDERVPVTALQAGTRILHRFLSAQ
ncbi:acetylornithine deacetylase/succinyl-diaminopimelate desuccinylase-like protein [Arthrobacter sp. V4I6]|uniref:M20/M25/M40 family metallo-hydrolase n=1 Tax=unclassified Arthrobacter TaxID=235627 RepID=UPI00278A78B3|nr:MULTISPECIES: M20/M25/M40 family metallo-hydrolase [unclassified Arthrobacter]MDQ0819535.1 acetylornithine deacetylase/succinyl-diaminopimelate desuccinylase-like protein [Arthrobacter sp. V1I7]MDQ0853717.1 acetylornithine deacetylase/succinyl-diaminopimelate desuccinylase-like protein [Arthrobacter sp. V4I6]